jgi:DNA-binding NarL/FixJ family response regulator
MGSRPVIASTILVIDDHAGFRATARRMLERDGWTVVGEAADGESGLAAAAALAPDVVVLDIGLPDVDGFVLVSSRDLAAYGDRVRRSPAVGFVSKDQLDGRIVRSLVTGSAA